MWQAPFSTRVDSITNFQQSRAAGDELIIDDLVPDLALLDTGDFKKIRQIALSEPLLKGLLISPTGDVTGVNVNFMLQRESPENVAKIVAFVREVTSAIERENPDVEFYLTGNVMLMAAFGEASDATSRF